MCSEVLALALYKCHLGVAGWSGIEDSLDERDRIRKSPLDFFFGGGGESRDTISVLTKEQKAIIEKLRFADALF
jgi:hypothetical protein